MTGEFLYFFVYVAQQFGVMLGVGAQTVLLCTHLTALLHREGESPHAHYARAAHMALGLGLLLIIVSGVVAVGVHVAGGQTNILLAPAFLFKWFLIALLLVAFFLYSAFFAWNSYYAIAGGTWYALFLVHSLGPVTSWITLWVLYILWGLFFAFVWFGFTAVMKWRARTSVSASTPIALRPLKQAASIPKPASAPAPVATVVIVPTPKPVFTPPPVIPVVVSAPPPPVVVVPTPAPVLAPTPTVIIQPLVQKIPWWRKLFSWSKKQKDATPVPVVAVAPEVKATSPAPTPTSLAKSAPLPPILTAPNPVISKPPTPIVQKPLVTPPPALVPALKPLSLTAHVTKPTTPAPAPVVVAKKIEPLPLLAPVVAAPTTTAPTGIVQDVIDHILVPALHIMPRTAEDIGKQRRPPVVK